MMKCRACGYDEDEYDDNKKFIHIEIQGQITIKGDAEYIRDIVDDPWLYICPKCGTVRSKSFIVEER